MVDDDTVSLKIMAAALKDHYHIEVSSAEEDALKTCQEQQPDLILLDINLKRGNGFNILESLKQSSATAGIPVIFITNDSCPDTEVEAFQLGASDYVIKPIIPPVLAAKVKAAISNPYVPHSDYALVKEQTRFLIIDDSPVDLAIAIECFKEETTVITATSGEEGIAAALDAKPNLILLDIVLPDADGYQVLTQLKNDERTQNIPVILASGEKIRDKHAIKGFEMGAVDHIEKPFHGELLKLRVFEQFKRVFDRQI